MLWHAIVQFPAPMVGRLVPEDSEEVYAIMLAPYWLPLEPPWKQKGKSYKKVILRHAIM